MSSRKKKIVIIGSLSSPVAIKTSFSSMHSAHWIYCGKDVPYSIELDRALGTEKKIRIGKDLQELAREFRQEYVDFIGKITCSLAEDPAIDTWYLSSISEKNPFISNVFLYFCYVKCCERIIDNIDDDILIISEDPALSRSIYSHLDKIKTLDISLEDCPPINDLTVLEKRIRLTAKKNWFIAITVYRIILAKIFFVLKRAQRLKNQGKKQICIHSFTDNRSINDDAHYQQVYFGSLGPDLTTAEVPFFYLIDVLPTTSYFSVLWKLLRYPEDCRLSEEFITVSEIIRACHHVNQWMSVRDWRLSLGDVQMDHILKAETKRDTMNSRREEAYLRFFIGKRIVQETPISSFVYIFENHIWEKMFELAFRSSAPKTRLIGYAHTIVNRMYTCYSISSCEKNILPLPNIIAVNGINAKESLVKSGFSPDRIFVTGAMRYRNFEQKRFRKKNHPEIIVLVALSAGINDTVELAQKVFNALGEREDFVVLLKCHPTTPFRIISRYFPIIPPNVRICEDPVEILLEKSDILLHSGSAVCIQALAEGIPAIFINSDYRIDMNILEDIPGILSATTPDEIFMIAKSALSPESLDQYEITQNVIDNFFTPLKDDYLSLIITHQKKT